MKGYGAWTLGDQQHWRIETDSSGLLAKLWLVEADGSETQVKYVYSADLSIDASRRNSDQPPVQLTICVAGDVVVTSALGAVEIQQADWPESGETG